MPSPGLWPAPTTMATRSFRRISVHSRDRVLLQYLIIIGLVVDLHRRKYAHHGAIERDGEHEVGHLLVGQLPLDFGESRLRHRQFTYHLAGASQDRLRQRLELGGFALG